MTMEGDGESQPTGGVATLTDLAAMMDGEEAAPEELDGEESEEPEEVEAEEEGDEDSEDDEQEEATFTIKVDGKEVTLKQSELIEQAQKGFDYTAKTMAVAEERKAVESVKAQATELRTQNEQALTATVQRLEAYAQFMEQQIGNPPPIEWAQQDAAYYLAQKELYENRKGQLHQANDAIQGIQNEQARNRQAWINWQAEDAEKVLRETLPGWNDDMLNDLSGYASKAGLNVQNAELAVLQPGFWQVINKAKAYDALLAQKATLKPKSELPKVQKPSATNQPPRARREEEAFKRHKTNPSISSLADLL